MDPTANELRQQAEELNEENDALVQEVEARIEDGGDGWTDEENENYEERAERIDALIERAEKLEDREDRTSRIGDTTPEPASGRPDPEPSASPLEERRSAYPRKFTGETPEIFSREFAPGDQELVNRVVGWHRAIARGDYAEARALSEGTDSEGGYLVHEDFEDEIVRLVGQLTPLANREFMRIIPMTRDVAQVPVENTRPTVSRIAENSSGDTGTDPAFGNVSLAAQLFGRVLPMSEQLLADADVAVLEYLRDVYAEVLAEKRNSLILTGSGTNEPEGVRNASGLTSNAADMTDGGTIHDSVVDQYNQLPPRAAQDAIWLASQQTWSVLAKTKATDDEPIVQRLADQPFDEILGRPLFVTEALPENLGTGSDESVLIFGNFRRGYVFGDRRQMEFAENRGGKYFENFQVAIRVSERYDGKVAQVENFAETTGWK